MLNKKIERSRSPEGGGKPVETIKIGRETGHAGSLHPCLTRVIFKPHVAFMLHCITLLCSILILNFYYLNKNKEIITSTKTKTK